MANDQFFYPRSRNVLVCLACGKAGALFCETTGLVPFSAKRRSKYWKGVLFKTPGIELDRSLLMSLMRSSLKDLVNSLRQIWWLSCRQHPRAQPSMSSYSLIAGVDTVAEILQFSLVCRQNQNIAALANIDLDFSLLDSPSPLSEEGKREVYTSILAYGLCATEIVKNSKSIQEYIGIDGWDVIVGISNISQKVPWLYIPSLASYLKCAKDGLS
ncbi:uncharacterized protein BDR25DRAFT_353194 [Lindgomyces ingoldianus]|uniref:Uncharacterized protein n=1 Tax=Lindgomyces ingoldianus TaxID=673940 RepID=A0ACB6R369_9PLEO|nr:uncharacterized protein BDR25DRAFT_353194 [Lindgomyces ingoldianus]KAF2472881.1 hypothetical protein BDR25DRAFT_353194 [Lindgomyces ingoldianus]